MQVLDMVVLGAMGIAAIFGLIKGFWSQLFGFLGMIVISVGTAYLYKYPMEWLKGMISNTTVLQIVCLIATATVIGIVYSIISKLLRKLLTGLSFMKLLDRLLGMVLAAGIVYCIFAIGISWLNGSEASIPTTIKQALGEQWTNSWVVNNLYKNNFFGDWLMKVILEQIAGLTSPTTGLLVNSALAVHI